MYELIYILTLVFAAYVIADIMKGQIILFIKNVFHLDLTTLPASLQVSTKKIKNPFS